MLIKAEYSSDSAWMVPMPGDWHFPKNLQEVLLNQKIYLSVSWERFYVCYTGVRAITSSRLRHSRRSSVKMLSTLSHDIKEPSVVQRLTFAVFIPSSFDALVMGDTFGTLPATHHTKYCRTRGCSFQLHYGLTTGTTAMETPAKCCMMTVPSPNPTSCLLGRLLALQVCFGRSMQKCSLAKYVTSNVLKYTTAIMAMRHLRHPPTHKYCGKPHAV